MLYPYTNFVLKNFVLHYLVSGQQNSIF